MSLPLTLSDAVLPKSEAACDALELIHADRTRHLTAIHPDGRVEAQSFRPSQRDEMRRWIEARQGVANLYFHVNGLKPGLEHIKAKKSDMHLGFYVHVDLDDPDAAEVIELVLPRPTFVVFSGGGFQLFWALSEPCADLDRLERVNAGMAKKLGGDRCHNVDRLMRIPFTINVPNAAKRAKGRTNTLARLLEEWTDWGLRYSLDQFEEADPEHTRRSCDSVKGIAPGQSRSAANTAPLKTTLN